MARPEELCWEASRDEQGYLALTDVNSLGRAPSFAVAAAHAGLRPLFGAELNVLPWGELQYRGTVFRVRLLVDGLTGWRTLLRLVNRARATECSSRPPFVPFAAVLEDLRGLILCLGGARGELTTLVRNGDLERIETMIPELLSHVCPDRVFVELPELREANGLELARTVQSVAGFFGLSTLAVPEVTCAHPADDAVFRLMHWRGGQPPRRLTDAIVAPALRSHLISRSLAAERYAEFPDALAKTLAVAQHCAKFQLPSQEKRFPVHDFCRGVDADSFIWNTAFAKATERYGDLPTRYKERLNREFREIVDAGLANAVVSMTRLREELEAVGVQRGPGAGLLTNSLVASLMGLTRLDPLHFDLAFELPPGLMSGAFPMLEFTIPGNQEGLAVGALAKLFGGNVAPVGDWQLWKQVHALEQFGFTLGQDGKWAAAMQKQTGFVRAREAQKSQPATWMPSADSAIESPEVLAWIARRMEGRLKVLKPLAGVYTFSVEALHDTVPLRHVPVGAGEEMLPLCEWSSEELGRLRHGRIRFAHPPLLDLIGEATALARDQGDLMWSPENAAADDAATYRLLREGRTQGIWPFETPLVRRRLRQGQPADLHALIRLFAPSDGEGPDLASVLLGHVCAVIKAHKPLAFFAAALSQATGDPRRTAMLLEEIRARGIRIGTLDVNYSLWRWTVERDSLRPGLMAVKALNPAAGQEITEKRRELHFADLPEFLHRTDRTRLKPAQVRALLRAGGLDDLGESRLDLARQLDQLLPLGRKGTGVEELSFFDRDADWWRREHGGAEVVAATEAPPLADLLAAERDAIGYTLQEVIPNELMGWARGAGVRTVDRLQPRDAGQVVSLTGVVALVQPDPGIDGAVLLDLAGCLIRAQGEPAKRLLEDRLAGSRVVVAGQLARENFQWRMELGRLATVEEGLARTRQSAALVLDLSGLCEQTWKPLLKVLRTYRGNTPVQMVWLPAEAPRVLRAIAACRVTICPGLEVELDRLAGGNRWSVEQQSEGAESIVAGGLKGLLRKLEVPLLRGWLAG